MGDALFLLIPIIVLGGGMGFVYLGILARMKAREMAHRERLAMIDRGLVPPPESSDATKFYAAVAAAQATNRSPRQRSAGVLMIGVGLALLTIITFVAQEANVGLGVGGAVVILGIAMLVNAHLGRHGTPPPPDATVSPPAPPSPPTNEPRS